MIIANSYPTRARGIIVNYISHRVCLGLSASNIRAQRKVLGLKLFKLYTDCFSSICELITMAGQMQNILWGRKVMVCKPHISF